MNFIYTVSTISQSAVCVCQLKDFDNNSAATHEKIDPSLRALILGAPNTSRALNLFDSDEIVSYSDRKMISRNKQTKQNMVNLAFYHNDLGKVQVTHQLNT